MVSCAWRYAPQVFPFCDLSIRILFSVRPAFYLVVFLCGGFFKCSVKWSLWVVSLSCHNHIAYCSDLFKKILLDLFVHLKKLPCQEVPLWWPLPCYPPPYWALSFCLLKIIFFISYFHIFIFSYWALSLCSLKIL